MVLAPRTCEAWMYSSSAFCAIALYTAPILHAKA